MSRLITALWMAWNVFRSGKKFLARQVGDWNNLVVNSKRIMKRQGVQTLTTGLTIDLVEGPVYIDSPVHRGWKGSSGVLVEKFGTL